MPLWNLKFTDYINLLAGTNNELRELTNLLANSDTRYGDVWMEISAEKSKVMVNSNNTSIHANITLYMHKLEEVNTLCYPGATLSKVGSCETEIKIILSLATSAMIRIYAIWNSKQINFKLKYNLFYILLLSILTYIYEIWTFNSVMCTKSKHSKTSPIGNCS